MRAPAREPMILLHLLAAAAYALAAWTLWPTHAASTPPAGASATTVPASSARPPAAWGTWLVPFALLLHAWIATHDVVKPEGVDLSLDNALSVVAGLVAAVAWASGLLRTLPSIGTVVLPVACAAALLPAFASNPHPFAYADAPLAALHVGVALIAYALFLVAAVQALVLMALEKRLHRRLPAMGADRAPPLLTLERFLFRLVATGFVLLTITIVSGSVFSDEVFGKPFTFTHKSVFSVLSWLVFGALLWGRWRYGWRGRVALRWILAGTVLLFLAYIGSKFVLEVLLHR
jgi:ABC-type uncharacterized transport system permease subunit